MKKIFFIVLLFFLTSFVFSENYEELFRRTKTVKGFSIGMIVVGSAAAITVIALSWHAGENNYFPTAGILVAGVGGGLAGGGAGVLYNNSANYRRLEYILNRNLSGLRSQRIWQGEVVIGQSENDMYAAMGFRPLDINISKGSYGTHKQFVYRDKYIYTEDGIVTAIQE